MWKQGISQVLPVLVAAYGSDSRIHAIEQPELHFHPKLQADLADVFIESALGPQKNTFIFERREGDQAEVVSSPPLR